MHVRLYLQACVIHNSEWSWIKTEGEGKETKGEGDLTSHLLRRVHLDGVEDTPVGEVHVGAEGVGQQSSEVPVAVVPADEGEDDPRLLGGHHGREGALQARLGDHERHGPAGEPQGS